MARRRVTRSKTKATPRHTGKGAGRRKVGKKVGQASSLPGKGRAGQAARRTKGRQDAYPTKRQPDAAAEKTDSGERLQKILAAAGIGSRRHCEQLILAGRVEVDRQVVTKLGAKADPVKQEIRVDGVTLPKRKRVYYVVNKPPGVVSTNRDPAGRLRVIDLVPAGDRLFTVGRLDLSSEGLILATNDGELANRLAHPRYGIEKTYHVEAAGYVAVETIDQLRKGIRLAEAVVRVSAIRIRRRNKRSTTLEIVLREGRNREIRRILARVGHKVQRLRRIALGPLRLGDLPEGAYRPLDRRELRSLRTAASLKGKPARGAPGAKQPGHKKAIKSGAKPARGKRKLTRKGHR